MHYGFGMFVERGYLTHTGAWYETPVWEHGGNTLSFSHLFYVLPELDFAVAICSSAYATDFQRAMDAALTTLAPLPAASPAPAYTFDPAVLDRHVGSYDDAWQLGAVTVTREGDSLTIDVPALTQAGQSYDALLEPVSSEIFAFTIEGYPYDLTFVPTEAGGDSQYIRNRAFVATRLPAEPPGTAAAAHPMRRAVRPSDLERWRLQNELDPSPIRRLLQTR
jgi:hypothetical protein